MSRPLIPIIFAMVGCLGPYPEAEVTTTATTPNDVSTTTSVISTPVETTEEMEKCKLVLDWDMTEDPIPGDVSFSFESGATEEEAMNGDEWFQDIITWKNPPPLLFQRLVVRLHGGSDVWPGDTVRFLFEQELDGVRYPSVDQSGTVIGTVTTSALPAEETAFEIEHQIMELNGEYYYLVQLPTNCEL